MNTTVQTLLEQERFFRENASAIANGDAGVLNELFSRFTPTLTKDQLIANAHAMIEAQASDDMVYTTYGSLSTQEIMFLATEQYDEGQTKLLDELKAIDAQALSTYETFQHLSRRRAELVLAIYEAGVPQAVIADTLGVARQRVYTLINQARKAREKQQ